MKKFFLIIILFVLFIFANRNYVRAQLNDILIPNVNCGIAGDIATNKCCAPNKLNTLIEPPDFGAPFNTLRNLILGPGMDFIRRLTSPIEEYQSKIIKPCQTGTKSTEDPSDTNCRCVFDGLTPTPGALNTLSIFCNNQSKENDKNKCNSCIRAGGVWTGIGCVEGSVSGFIRNSVFGLGIGLAGGFALLCIIYAAFQMQSSQGNPEKLKKAQEMITSCIMGLMLIIFSVFILRLIGVNILQIPGFK